MFEKIGNLSKNITNTLVIRSLYLNSDELGYNY